MGDPALYGSAAKAKAGDIIQLYATGLGSSPSGNTIQNAIAFSQPVIVKIGSTTVNALGAALVAVGEFQVNFIVPSLPGGDYPLAIQVGSAASQSGVILPIGH